MKTKRKFSIIRSQTWLGDNYEVISSILEDTIKDFVEDERVINIHIVKEGNGLRRFWIYLEKII